MRIWVKHHRDTAKTPSSQVSKRRSHAVLKHIPYRAKPRIDCQNKAEFQSMVSFRAKKDFWARHINQTNVFFLFSRLKFHFFGIGDCIEGEERNEFLTLNGFWLLVGGFFIYNRAGGQNSFSFLRTAFLFSWRFLRTNIPVDSPPSSFTYSDANRPNECDVSFFSPLKIQIFAVGDCIEVELHWVAFYCRWRFFNSQQSHPEKPPPSLRRDIRRKKIIWRRRFTASCDFKTERL